jgi:hypothetical protein
VAYCGAAEDGFGFFQIQEAKINDIVEPVHSSVAARFTVESGEVSPRLLLSELARIIPVNWKWEAHSVGPNCFVVPFPNSEELERMVAIGTLITRNKEGTLLVDRFVDDVQPIKILDKVWVTVTKVPLVLRSFLQLWAVGTMIGATQKVDMYHLRQTGEIRILVAVFDVSKIQPFADVCVKGCMYRLYFKPDEKVKENAPEEDDDDLLGDEDKGLDGDGDNKMEDADPPPQPQEPDNGKSPILPSTSQGGPTHKQAALIQEALDLACEQLFEEISIKVMLEKDDGMDKKNYDPLTEEELAAYNKLLVPPIQPHPFSSELVQGAAAEAGLEGLVGSETPMSFPPEDGFDRSVLGELPMFVYPVSPTGSPPASQADGGELTPGEAFSVDSEEGGVVSSPTLTTPLETLTVSALLNVDEGERVFTTPLVKSLLAAPLVEPLILAPVEELRLSSPPTEPMGVDGAVVSPVPASTTGTLALPGVGNVAMMAAATPPTGVKPPLPSPSLAVATPPSPGANSSPALVSYSPKMGAAPMEAPSPLTGIKKPKEMAAFERRRSSRTAAHADVHTLHKTERMAKKKNLESPGNSFSAFEDSHIISNLGRVGINLTSSAVVAIKKLEVDRLVLSAKSNKLKNILPREDSDDEREDRLDTVLHHACGNFNENLVEEENDQILDLSPIRRKKKYSNAKITKNGKRPNKPKTPSKIIRK